ncbi:hypothetical protein F511_38973 [Dorcoceras hygrometricum]|uniref:Uncharacterized protein n=1 Tax=Dorcoceras hygrometricum TaxID=472368 RepID=A0A2Z7C3D9_9LAMI|nr:hypothetical protein F511_38973 [Dorcoceras hygrometricum]
MGVTTDFGMSQTDANELSLVNSAVNEIIDETADTYMELSCWGKSDVNGISVEQTADATEISYEQRKADAKEII